MRADEAALCEPERQALHPPALRERLGVDRRVVVSGVGLVTPLGHSLADFGRALFDEATCMNAVSTRHAPPIPGARVHADVAAGLCRSELLLGDRSVHLALLAASRALDDAGLAPRAPARQRCGVFVGCSTGPSQSVSDSYATLHGGGRLPGLTLLRCMPSGPAAAIAIRHGLHGPSQTYSGACASSTTAIGEAMRAIRHGYLDLALVGGTEAPFGDGNIKAWQALRLLAPLTSDAGAACRPFDRDRRGIVLGEGAAFFVIESEAHAQARGAKRHARIAGYAGASDGHHWTEPDVRGQIQAMRSALADAQLDARRIGSVNAYGAGTAMGDPVEAEAIAAVFGAGSEGPLVSSTKSAHGHLLGASGAIELAASIVTLKQARVPATRNLTQPDPRCALNLVRHRAEPLPAGAAVLSDSFAFGGSNACLVLAPA
ncbi:MAG: beta-ketoacyl-[acyl-carrier-protein] synthase family protein [Burkholderiales bacterium]|nr:beta-ketoacyl-[acyl-carrier-protein] synthase family protein [Burkholderiales bacterium]